MQHSPHTNVTATQLQAKSVPTYFMLMLIGISFINANGSLPRYNSVKIVLRVTKCPQYKNVSLSQHSFVGTLLITLSARPALNAISLRPYIAEYSKMVCTCLSGLQFLLGYRFNPVHE